MAFTSGPAPLLLHEGRPVCVPGRATRGRPADKRVTHFDFFGDLEVLMDNVLHLHHEHPTRGLGAGLRRHLQLGLGAQAVLRLLLGPLGLPPGLLLVLPLGLLRLHLQLPVDVDPEKGAGGGEAEAGGPGTSVTEAAWPQLLALDTELPSEARRPPDTAREPSPSFQHTLPAGRAQALPKALHTHPAHTHHPGLPHSLPTST